jgi:AraC-like DNA-binding protein
MPHEITLEVLLSREVCRLLDTFAAAMNIQVVFFSRQGKILKRGKSFGNTPYCTLIQEKFFGVEKCILLDQEMQQKCLESGKVLSYRCHGNLNEIIAPVKISGDVAGFVVFGQFRTVELPPPCARSCKEALEAFNALPFFDTEALTGLEDMIRVLIDYIISKELISYSGDFRYQRLLSFIDTHLSGKPTLKQAARFLNMSESGLTHFLHDNYQTSFKKLLIEKRLLHAEKLWREKPDLSISETAQLSGYDDPHYFARIYHKFRNKTPGQARKEGAHRES